MVNPLRNGSVSYSTNVLAYCKVQEGSRREESHRKEIDNLKPPIELNLHELVQLEKMPKSQ